MTRLTSPITCEHLGHCTSFITPVCVKAKEDAHVAVCSVKLGLAVSAKSCWKSTAGQQPHQIAVLLFNDQDLAYEARFPASNHGTLLRFSVPADRLAQQGVLTAYVALCDEQGRVAKIVDCGRLLVLPPDAAGEVTGMFSKTTRQVQSFFGQVRGNSTDASSFTSSSSSSSSSEQQPSRQGLGLLQRSWSSLAAKFTQNVYSSRSNGQHAAGNSREGSCKGPAGASSSEGSRKGQAAVSNTTGHTPSVAAASTGDGAGSSSTSSTRGPSGPATEPSMPDAATLYAYEHFFTPFLRQWASVVNAASSNEESLAVHSSSLSGLLPEAGVPAQAVQLLSFLLDNEMWACCVLLLGKYPALAESVQQAGLASPEDFSNPVIVNRMQIALQPMMQQSPGQLQQPPLVVPPPSKVQPPPQQLPQWQPLPQLQLTPDGQPQQQRLLANGQQHLLSTEQQQQLLQQLLQQSGLQPLWATLDSGLMPMFPMTGSDPTASDRHSPSGGSEDSYENASEILRRLGVLQQTRGEQEALEQEALEAFEAEGQLLDMLEEAVQASMSTSTVVLTPQQQHQHQQQNEEGAAGPVPLDVPPVPMSEAVASLPSLSATSAAPAPALQPAGTTVVATATAEARQWQPMPPFGQAAARLEPVAEMACTRSTLAQQGPGFAGVQADAAPALAAFLVGGVAATVPAGLQQHRGTAGTAAAASSSSILSKQRKLSWEEEQADGWVRKTRPQPAPALPAAPQITSPPATNRHLDQTNSSSSGGGGGGGCGGLICQPEACLAVQHQPNAYQDGVAADAGQHNACQEEAPTGAFAEALSCRAGAGSLDLDRCCISTPVKHHHSIEEEEQAVCCGSQQWWEQQGSSSQQWWEQQQSHSSPHWWEQQAGSESKGSRLGSGSNDKSSSLCCNIAASSCFPDCVLGPASRGSFLQQALLLVKLACCGFHDSCLESSYLVFKNHGCNLMDATCGSMCAAMLFTAACRSLNLRSDPQALVQLLTLVLYGLFFFWPYMVMRNRVQLFLRLRELSLVLSRALSLAVLCLMRFGLLPEVRLWSSVATNTFVVQLQNGVILPSCQQVRLPAMLAVAAAHVPGDAVFLSYGRPFGSALVHSCLTQLCAVIVTVGLDAWCRSRFLQRYSGMASSAARQHQE